MTRKSWKPGILLLLFTPLTYGCDQALPEVQLIEDVAAALGGPEQIQSLRTLRLEGEAYAHNIGQHVNANGDPPRENLNGFVRTLDFENLRARSEGLRSPTVITPVDPYRQVLSLDGDVAFSAGGFTDNTASRTTRNSEEVARDRRVEFFLHHPVGILRAALDPAAKLDNRRSEKGEELVDITTARGETITLAVDPETDLPASVASTTYHNVLGDVTITTVFEDYRDIQGLRLPMRLTSTIDRWPYGGVAVATYTIDASADGLAAPDAVKAMPTVAQAPSVMVEPMAPGVWALGAAGSHSLVVEFSDHAGVVEPYGSEARTLAVIAKARELVPGKPLTKMVVTHHHFDHTGGLRAAISEGLTIVAHEASRQLFEDLAQRKHRIRQDALAKNPQPLKLETVGDRAVVSDPLRTMEIYYASGNPHADTLLFVYLPRERILFQGDLFLPAFARQPYAPNFVDHITRLKLRVDRQVAVHGGIVKQTEAEKAIEKALKSAT